jgi:hypothetical protein
MGLPAIIRRLKVKSFFEFMGNIFAEIPLLKTESPLLKVESQIVLA